MEWLYDCGVLVASRIDRTGINFYPTVIVNRSRVLDCVTVGIPKPVITWYKDGSRLSLGEESNVRSVDDGAKLQIYSAELEDSGTYECRAENAAGRDRVHYQLRVLGQSSLSVVVVSCNWMSALVAPSGECWRGEGLVWLIGAVVC